MTKLMVEFKNAAKTYRNRPVFEHLNLKLPQGEIIGIQGPSGGGKSTILKMAAGLIRPSAGQALVHAQTLGYVFQEPRLLPWYTALDNILLALVAQGKPKKKARKIATKFMADMGLTGFETHYPGELSGGMNQRISIARALAVKPDLLLMDEPFTGLDPALKASVRNRIQTLLASTPTCVIHVTHAKEELMDQTDRLYTLSRGKLFRASLN